MEGPEAPERGLRAAETGRNTHPSPVTAVGAGADVTASANTHVEVLRLTAYVECIMSELEKVKRIASVVAATIAFTVEPV